MKYGQRYILSLFLLISCLFFSSLSVAGDAVSIQDQVQLFDNGESAITSDTYQQESAQVITAGVDGVLDAIELHLINFGGSTADLVYTIFPVTAGLIDDAPMASGVVDVSNLPTSYNFPPSVDDFTRIDLSTNEINLASGEQFAFSLRSTERYNLRLGATSDDPYSEGQIFTRNNIDPSTWGFIQWPADGSPNFYDWVFITYITPSGSPTPMLDSDSDGVFDQYDECADTTSGLSVNIDGCALSQIDSDNDGYTDDIDQCVVSVKGWAVNESGCSLADLDSDGDGFWDAWDDCPDTPTGQSIDSEGCALSQKDSDNDGYTDDIDQCVLSVRGWAVNESGCSLADLDSDGDGFWDAWDNCPDTPTGESIDSEGCSLSQL